jgi:CDP-diacylglycerol--glycerol-3-phosphate 3-phosphatidyltransferase
MVAANRATGEDQSVTAPIPSRAEYLAGWAALHGGYDIDRPSLVRFWLSIVYVVARPFALLRVPPDAITVAGGLLTAVAAWVAGQGERGPLIASALILLTGLLDNLDGAVAVLTDRASRWGHVLDSAVDRIADALYAVALVLAGAAIAPAALAAFLSLELEYVRARAGTAGMTELGVVTIAEKPTRVLVAALFLLGAGLYPASASGWANAGAITWAIVGGIGLLQLLLVVRRRLR